MTYRLLRVMIACSLCFSIQAATITVPGIDLPADCGLAQNEHPRLLFRQRDLQKYKDRIAGPMKADFERFKSHMDKIASTAGYDWSNIEATDGVAFGVLYQLTGDKKYADILRNSSIFKHGNTEFWQYPFALDLVIDAMPQAEIQQATDKFLAKAPNWGYGNPGYYLLAIALYGAGSTRDAELAALIAKGIPRVKSMLGYQDFWANDRGGDQNSHSYLGNHSLIHYAGWICGNANALGSDGWQDHKWMRHLGSYFIYHYYPGRNNVIRFDNSKELCAGPCWGEFCAGSLLAAAPSQYQDGLYQWWTNSMLVQEDPSAQGYYAEVRHNFVMTRLWGKILFYDSNIPELGPENFPPSRFFSTRGIASMRENWSKDATFVHFRCGHFGGLGDIRHNADNNSFSINKSGVLALDSGAQHDTETSGLKFEATVGDTARHIVLYSSETIAHNSILVRHEVDDAFWEGYHKPNSGGQILRRWPTEWDAKRGFKCGNDEAPTGKILAWETSPEYDYVCGDASGSYSPESLKSFTRQLVYIRPNIVVIFDRVETAIDGCRTSWLLHAADRPTIDGSEKPDTRIHPDGHFLWEGSTMTITDNEMGGRLFCKTLLPAKREMRLLGGENHEFELSSGLNPGPIPETYMEGKDDQKWALKTARTTGLGLRGWRIEVDDTNGSRSNRFLHVLQTCDKGTASMAPCTFAQSAGKATAKIDIDGRQIEVSFADSGDVAGHISVKKAGKAVVDRPLATKIEDDYQRWDKHPDYQKWMTDPFRQSVIMGTTPEPAQKKKK